MFFTPLTIRIPGIKPLTQSHSNFMFKYSSIIMYKSGDRGKPCLNPLLSLKNPSGHPMTKAEIQGLLIQVEIHRMKSSLIPNWWRTSKRKECLTWSNAFSMSNYHSFVPFSFACVYCFLCYDYIIFDFPFLHKTTLICWYNFGEKNSNPRYYNFFIILYDALHKEIALTLAKDTVFCSWGTMARNAKFVPPPILKYFWTYYINITKSYLTVFHKTL